ncbi:MAG: B12-binding domain-containing radical SAM protein [Deltaproteobacteria bacterium]|nr:B12-binding domain-containing radical SAM protein [Deltaproteobacteria bacterium]
MRIHLVSPRNPESFWTMNRILRTLGKRCVFPNLALPTLAGLTPERHEVTFCDENVEEVDFDVEADLVGITGYMVHRQRMFELIDGFRARGKLVAVGGPCATLCPEEFEGKVDILFVGEAEETWEPFLADFESGSWEKVYRTEKLPDLRKTPVPRYELLRMDRYRTMPMQFSRGCPFECEFCDIIVMYGRKPRTKSVACAMAEVERLHELGVTNAFLVDDNFIGNRARAKEFLRELAAWQVAHRYPLRFMTEVSLNLSRDDELLELLRAAHFQMLFIGIESPRHSSLAEAGKSQNARDDMLQAVHKIQSYGFEVDAGMIVGFDSDDPDVFEEQFRFIQEARIPISMTGLLNANAMPKTPLHERISRAGRLLAETTGDQFVFSNIIPAGMTRLELYEGYRRLLRRLYAYGNYRKRAMALILGRGKLAFSDSQMRRGELTIVWRFLRDCVLRASPRRQLLTLSMLLETAIRKPARLRDAISLALMHKHFYEYVEDLTAALDRMIEGLREAPDSVGLLPSANP